MIDTDKPVRLTVTMPESLRTEFKVKCVTKRKTMNDQIVELIQNWIKTEETEQLSNNTHE
ncbi:plasmid partition protein ParG [Microcoleus sp. herbarium7]|uniref:plasmid partition protein ParG n=1 Tax=Microcoleus sp. herbarium7 TaxID=3055435 RepID=UPI003B08819E